MTERGEMGLELDAWSRAKAATKRITSRGRPPQQEEPDWEDGGGRARGGIRTHDAASRPTVINRPFVRSGTHDAPTVEDDSTRSDAAVRVVADLEGAS